MPGQHPVGAAGAGDGCVTSRWIRSPCTAGAGSVGQFEFGAEHHALAVAVDRRLEPGAAVGPGRRPSQISPVAGSRSRASIQSAVAAARSRCPVRASRIAAGPLAGVFLKTSPRRQGMPPPSASDQAASDLAGQPAGSPRRGRCPVPVGALQGQREPGHVVVVGVGPSPAVAQPDAADQPADQPAPVRPAGRGSRRRPGSPAGAPATSSSSRGTAGARPTAASCSPRARCRAAPRAGGRAGAARPVRPRRPARPAGARRLAPVTSLAPRSVVVSWDRSNPSRERRLRGAAGRAVAALAVGRRRRPECGRGVGRHRRAGPPAGSSGDRLGRPADAADASR